MIKIVALFVGFIVSIKCFSQQPELVFYFDEDYKIVEKDKAVITGKGHYDSGHFKLECFEIQTGFRLISAQFTDEKLSVFEGRFVSYYNDKGTAVIQSMGTYSNNEKQGVWEDWNQKGQKTDSAYYENGVRLKLAQYTYFNEYNKKNNGMYSYQLTDSLANTLSKYFYSDSGTISAEVMFTGNTGVWKKFKKGGDVIDTVYTREEVEAQFPGGNAGWTRFLEKSLAGFNPAENGAKPGVWRVIVRFVVSEDGSISNVTPLTKFGYKMEEKVVRALSNGPKWVPARQYGKPVKAYRSQPVTFIVEVM